MAEWPRQSVGSIIAVYNVLVRLTGQPSLAMPDSMDRVKLVQLRNDPTALLDYGQKVAQDDTFWARVPKTYEYMLGFRFQAAEQRSYLQSLLDECK